MSGLRTAASALIAEAPETALVAVLQLLINSFAPAAATPTTATAIKAKATDRRPTKPGTAAKPAAPLDPAWLALRQQVRQAMRTRGLDAAGVAREIERSPTTLRIVLGCRRMPSAAVRTRLRAWLEQEPPAPEVATPSAFRGAHESRRQQSSNGSAA